MSEAYDLGYDDGYWGCFKERKNPYDVIHQHQEYCDYDLGFGKGVDDWNVDDGLDYDVSG